MDHLHEFVRPTSGFTQVPDRLIDDERLTADDLAALVWIGSRPDGYLLRTSQIRERFGWGKDRWQAIFRRLRAVGAVSTQWRRCKRSGRLIGQSYRWSWEQWVRPTESRATRPTDQPVDKSTESRVSRPPGNPAYRAGTSGLVGRNIRPLKEERKKEGATSGADAPPDAPDGNDAAGRREAIQPGAGAGLGEEDRVIPSLERRRDLARELGLTPDAAFCPGLFDAESAEDA